MDNININALIDGSATIETMIDVLPLDDSGDIVRLTNEDSIKSWEYSDIRYVPDNGFIGMFVERTLEGVLQNITEEFNIENREIILYLGIRRYVDDITEDDLIVPDGAYDVVTGSDSKLGYYITTFYCLGNFIVDKPDSDEVKDNTQYTARDYTIKFNVPFNADYVDDEFTASFNDNTAQEDSTGVTAEWLARYTCKQVGVELGNTDFTNSDFIISSNQFQNGDYCRDVMKSIGKLAYSWVRIGWDNKAYLDFKVKTNVEQEYNNITKDNYYTLDVQKEEYGPINKVVLGSSIIEGDYSYQEDADSITSIGEKTLVINDNPILYTEEIRESAKENANVLFGLVYTPLTTETTGHPWLQGNELISIIDKNDNVLYAYPFDRVITYNGHIKTALSSYAQTEVEEDYHYDGTGSAIGERRKTQITIDREKQRIDALTSTTKNLDTKIENNQKEIINKFDGYIPQSQFVELETSVNQLQTDTYTKTEINTKLTDGSVTKVKTTSGTFDEDGMHYEKTGAPTSSTINEKGVEVEDSSKNDLLYAGYVDEEKTIQNTRLKNFEGQSVVYTQNAIVDNYFVMGTHSRTEDYETGTGVFYIGG